MYLYQNVLYGERVKSFDKGGWPLPATSIMDKCTPHELAMAGLEFVRPGEAKCVICHRIVTNLGENSNPWTAHMTKNPKCPLIVLGKPRKPDGYSMETFLDLLTEKQTLRMEMNLINMEAMVKGLIKDMVKEEKETIKRQG